MQCRTIAIYHILLGITVAVVFTAKPIRAAEAVAIDPAQECTKYQTVSGQTDKDKTNDLQKKLTHYSLYATFDGTRYILCFQPTNNPQQQIALIKTLAVQGLSGKPLVVYGLSLKPSGTYAVSFLQVSGADITLQALTLTGPGPTVANTVGVKLSGTGHQVLDSKIAGFDTGILADCAWPPGTIGSFGPSCTIGPANVIGVSDPTDTTSKKLVNIGVRVPATGQQVTVTQNTIMTVLDKTSPVFDTDTKRIALESGANSSILPLPIILSPKEEANLWANLSEDQQTITKIVGILPNTGGVELFLEPENWGQSVSKFLTSCVALKKDATHYAALDVPDDTWLYECDNLSILFSNKAAHVALVYTHDSNSASYRKWVIDEIGTIPVTPIQIPDTVGATPSGPIGGGSDGGDSVAPAVGGEGGDLIAFAGPTDGGNPSGPIDTGPGDVPPTTGPSDPTTITPVPTDDGKPGTTAVGMTGGMGSPMAGCSALPHTTARPPSAAAFIGMGLGLLLMGWLALRGVAMRPHGRPSTS